MDALSHANTASDTYLYINLNCYSYTITDIDPKPYRYGFAFADRYIHKNPSPHRDRIFDKYTASHVDFHFNAKQHIYSHTKLYSILNVYTQSDRYRFAIAYSYIHENTCSNLDVFTHTHSTSHVDFYFNTHQYVNSYTKLHSVDDIYSKPNRYGFAFADRDIHENAHSHLDSFTDKYSTPHLDSFSHGYPTANTYRFSNAFQDPYSIDHPVTHAIFYNDVFANSDDYNYTFANPFTNLHSVQYCYFHFNIDLYDHPFANTFVDADN